jgi:DNA polymerase iota
MIDYNISLLNQHDLAHSFFYLDRQDPTRGFAFDATRFCGPTFPSLPDIEDARNSLPRLVSDVLSVRLVLGSHLAHYLRTRLEEERGYTAAVGVSTSKLLAKLVGNVNKPNNQTTLIPPYVGEESNVTRFLDSHEVGKVPGIGFKLAHKLRTHVLGHEPTSEPYTVQPQEDRVTVRDVRLFPDMGPVMLLKMLGGPGAPRDIGARIWALLHGVDPSEVLEARTVPTQISIEDSYRGLDHFDAVKNELRSLAVSLIRRMRIDLTEEDAEEDVPTAHTDDPQKFGKVRWLAHPRTLRLSTRRRGPQNSDGSRSHSFNRVSRSGPVPSFIFNLDDSVEAVANRLVEESLLSMFRKLHPERSFGELSLINIAVTNMVESAGEQKQSSGRDIGKMLRQQESVLKDWRVSEPDAPASLESSQPLREITPGLDNSSPTPTPPRGVLGQKQETKDTWVVDVQDATWEESDDEELISNDRCSVCGAFIPYFALAAHSRYHEAPD